MQRIDRRPPAEGLVDGQVTLPIRPSHQYLHACAVEVYIPDSSIDFAGYLAIDLRSGAYVVHDGRVLKDHFTYI